MPFIFFVTAVYLSLVLVQSFITSPVEFFVSFHLPFWLMVALGGSLLAWLIGE
jgi:hypothetical protein